MNTDYNGRKKKMAFSALFVFVHRDILM